MSDFIIEIAKTISRLAEENERLKSAATCHDDSLDRVKSYAENLEKTILEIADSSEMSDTMVVFANKIRSGQSRPFVFGWKRKWEPINYVDEIDKAISEKNRG